MIRRIDNLILDGAKWSLTRTTRVKDHLWLWWQYTFREPYADPVRANESLKEICNYKVLPCTEVKLKCVIPLIRWLRFGVLVFFVPVKQKSQFWTICWVRWVEDPLELFLVRSAARGVTPVTHKSSPINKTSHTQENAYGLFDSISSEEMNELLRP